MKDLKNIRNYDQFKDSLNEELLWDAVKKLFSTLFGKMDKKLADSINNFTRKIDGSKTYEDAVKFFIEEVNVRMQYVNEIDDNITGPLGLRKVIVDLSEAVYLSLQVMVNKYQNLALSPKNFFKGQPDEKMFSFDTSKDFQANVMNFVNAKIIQMNKTAKNGAPAYDETALQKYLTENTDVNSAEALAQLKGGNQQQPATNNNNQPNQTAQQPVTNQQNNQQPANKTIDTKDMTGAQLRESLINEEYTLDSYGNPVSTRNTTTPTTPPATTPPATTPPTTPSTDQKPADPKAAPQGDIKALEGSVLNWVNTVYNQFVLKKIKEIKPTAASTGNVDPFDNVAKGSKATKNTQNLAKLLRNIVNVQDDNILGNIRDAVAKAQNKDVNQFKQDIGTF
jgi:hypothetical protein